MKINWGTGLVIGLVLFIAFIMFFVVKMSTDEKYSHDLVTEEYYKRDLAYQEEIDAEENLNNYAEKMTSSKTDAGWQIVFPSDMDPTKIKGTVFLYRPSNKQLDFDFPIELSGSNLLIPDNRLLDGRWNITVAWNYKGEDFLYKTSIHY